MLAPGPVRRRLSPWRRASPGWDVFAQKGVSGNTHAWQPEGDVVPGPASSPHLRVPPHGGLPRAFSFFPAVGSSEVSPGLSSLPSPTVLIEHRKIRGREAKMPAGAWRASSRGSLGVWDWQQRPGGRGSPCSPDPVLVSSCQGVLGPRWSLCKTDPQLSSPEPQRGAGEIAKQ